MKKIIDADVVAETSKHYRERRVMVHFRSAGDHTAVRLSEPIEFKPTVKIEAVNYDTQLGTIKLRDTVKMEAVKIRPTVQLAAVQLATIKLKGPVEEKPIDMLVDEPVNSTRYSLLYPDEERDDE